MTTPVGRRDFLEQSAATGLLLGFPFLVPQEGAGAEPAPTGAELLDLARRRMKQEVRPGVVILIPPDPDDAQRLARDLGDLLGAGNEWCFFVSGKEREEVGKPPVTGATDPSVQRLFCQAVFVCVPLADVRKAFPDVRPGSAALLLDAAGRPLDQLAADPTLFGKDFPAKMKRFLHGPRGAHLATAGAAQRAALGPAAAAQLDAAVRDLDADDFTARENASRRLAELAPRAPALLAAALEAAPGLEPRRRLERLFADLFWTAAAEKPGPRLPYGVRWETVTKGVDPCPGCGMGGFWLYRSRLFLRFVTDKTEKQK